MPASEVNAFTGVVIASGSGFTVNTAGTGMPVFFPAGYIPTQGDNVMVLRVDGQLYVLGPVSSNPRPPTGTVAGAASGGMVPVAVTVGPSPIACRYVGTAPSIGDLVRLDWQSTTPWVWPSTAAVVPPPPEPPPPPPTPPEPPPPPQTGTTSFAVVDAASWRPGYGRWDGGRVMQWRYGSESESMGAWFLGVAPKQVRGRTITRLLFGVGTRLRIGPYNDALTANFYLLANPTRPGGDVARIAGPFGVSVAPGGGFQAFDLPASWGTTLATNGGGIGIAGAPYLGFDPSGSVATLDWTR